MDIIVNDEVGQREASFKSAHGSTVDLVLDAMSAPGILVDEEGAVVNAKRMVLPPGTYTFRKKRQQQHDDSVYQRYRHYALKYTTLPSVLVGNVLKRRGFPRLFLAYLALWDRALVRKALG